MRDQPGRIRSSRRQLLKGLAGAAALPLIGGHRSAAAGNDWPVYANTSWDRAVGIWTEPAEMGEAFAWLEPGTIVQLLDGPSSDGWYFVDPIHLANIPAGWVPGWEMLFEQRARTFVDQTLLGAPDDWSSEIAPLRHGFTVTLIGPVASDWVLVRSGGRVGYASIFTMEPAEGPETDRFAEYWVDVDRTSSDVRLYVGDSLVDRFDASVSADDGEGFYATAVGTYWIYQKIEELTYTPYADAYFQHWAGFDPDRFNGFHSWTMDAGGSVLNGGWGTTAGCVATAPEDAWLIYQFVDLGSRVEIHW